MKGLAQDVDAAVIDTGMDGAVERLAPGFKLVYEFMKEDRRNAFESGKGIDRLVMLGASQKPANSSDDLEEVKLKVGRFRNIPQDGVVRGLLAGFNLPEGDGGVLGRAVQYFAE